MLSGAKGFGGLAVDDIEAAKVFYNVVLGLNVKDIPSNGFEIHFDSGGGVFVYEKDDHDPANFTVMNFSVPNLEDVVDELRDKNVEFQEYDDMDHDDKGIVYPTGEQSGPAIAWFEDPAGNIIAIMESDEE